MKLSYMHLIACTLMLSAGLLAGCLDLSSGEDDLKAITLYGFSVKGEAIDNTIIPSFRDHWKDKTGENVNFVTSYAGSGRITNQVLTGAEAEVMILSTEWDAIQLRNGGVVTTDWKTFPHNGTVSISPWVILVRKGNPKNIQDLPDLARNDIELLHADPRTSGGACWSIFTLYGSELRRSENASSEAAKEKAKQFVEDVMKNVISWQSSARNALSQFTLGYGDALITYENDALLCIQREKDYEIIYPSSTIYSEHKVVIVDRNVDEDEREMVEEFVNFLFTTDSQVAFVNQYFRSANDTIETPYPDLLDHFTVEYLGGWEKAHEELIDGLYSDIRG